MRPIVGVGAALAGSVFGGDVVVMNTGETNRTTDASMVMLSGAVTGVVDEAGFGWGPTDGGTATGEWANRVKGRLLPDGQVRAYVGADGPNYYRCYAKEGDEYVWAPVPYRFVVDKNVSEEAVYADYLKASEEAEAWLKRDADVDDKYEIEYVNGFWDRAHLPGVERETFPQSWQEWTTAFNGVVVEPPVVFVVTNPVPRDAGSLLGSFKFLQYATYQCESNALASVCDPRATRLAYGRLTGPHPIIALHSRCRIYMTTSYSHRGEQFRGILYRMENESAPTTHWVSYEYDVFRYTDGEYRHTDDLRLIPFCSVVTDCPHGVEWKDGLWADIVDGLRQTGFPPSFYEMP